LTLKQGDKVIVRWKNERETATVEGFYYYGMKLKGWEVIPFKAARFYGCGYAPYPIYILKKDWHYIPAKVFEWVRLNGTFKGI
jgi:hypothetical protein